MIPALVFSGQVTRRSCQPCPKQQIDNAWIRVPWSNGGYYYHNTLTRDDQDEQPTCLSVNGNGINFYSRV